MPVPDLSALPGGELVMRGLHDLAAGAHGSVPALLVQIAAPRLAAAGLRIPPFPAVAVDAELRLYVALGGEQDPFGEYQALLRRLVSCEAALESPAVRKAA